jgi:glyoxylase-like metal-dependent hydrolase (beta-lactamase superfamily II)
MRRALRFRITPAFACILAGVAGLTALSQRQQRAAAFTFTRIADNVYFAVGTGALTVFCNAAIVINENDVLLVDTHVSPDAAQALLTELKTLTSKPVKYVVNTHFHFDHSSGNQVYGPDVEIIGHDFTREKLADGSSLRGAGYDRFIGGVPAAIARLQQQRDTTTDAAAKATLSQRIAAQEEFKRQTDTIRATPPSVSFDHTMTLYRGGREIRLFFVGRAHTGGDVFVFLPKERVLVSGDALQSGIPFMGDGYFADWPETLEKLKTLEFDVVLPGHGAPFSDRNRITYLQEYMRDFWAKVQEQKRLGATAEEASRRIDMRNHAAHFPSITAVGADIAGVRRAYALLSN